MFFPQPPEAAIQSQEPSTVTMWANGCCRKQSMTPFAVPELLSQAAATHSATALQRTLLEDGYDIRTVQELLGHKDVRTTMIYTHVLNRGGRGVMSPADLLGADL